MGVQFDRILDGFDGPFEVIAGPAKPPAGKISGSRNPAGYLVSHRVNDAFLATNRLLANKEKVYWLPKSFSANGKSYEAGTIFIPAQAGTLPHLQKLAAETGLNFEGTDAKLTGEAIMLRPVRIGLWDRYGGSMPSGWVRWLLEKFEFPFEVVYPPALDAGNLASKYDVLIFVDGAIVPRDSGESRVEEPPSLESIPEEYRGRIGRVTANKTIPELGKFLEGGGTVLAIGGSTSLGQLRGLPLRSALTERLPNGTERALPREKYYVPGSILRARVDA